MRKKIQIFVMILALGTFILPTQNFFAQTSTMECCSPQKPDSNSCHNERKENSDCSKNHQKHEGCKDNCCTNCNGCHSFFVPMFVPLENQKNNSEFNIGSNAGYNYRNPHFSTLLQEIWQPPKIA